MGWYQQAIGAEVAPREPRVIISKEKAGDTFWTAVKWVGAGMILLTAYREAQSFYREKLRDEHTEEKEDE